MAVHGSKPLGYRKMVAVTPANITDLPNGPCDALMLMHTAGTASKVCFTPEDGDAVLLSGTLDSGYVIEGKITQVHADLGGGLATTFDAIVALYR